MECVVLQEPFSRLGIQDPQYTEILNKWQEIIVCIYSKHSDEDMYLNVLKTITRQYNTMKEMYDAYSTALIPLYSNVRSSDFNVSYNLNGIRTILKRIIVDGLYQEPFSSLGFKEPQLSELINKWNEAIMDILVEPHANPSMYQEVLKVITQKYNTMKEMYDAYEDISTFIFHNGLNYTVKSSVNGILMTLKRILYPPQPSTRPLPPRRKLDPFGPSRHPPPRRRLDPFGPSH